MRGFNRWIMDSAWRMEDPTYLSHKNWHLHAFTCIYIDKAKHFFCTSHGGYSRHGERTPNIRPCDGVPGDANPQWMYIWDSIDQLVAGFSTSLAFFHVHSLFKKTYWGVDDPTWLSYMFWWFNHCCSHSLVKISPQWRAGPAEEGRQGHQWWQLVDSMG